MKKSKIEFLSSSLKTHYPLAKCSLVFHSPYECLVTVLLSAQCTDEKVNKVTPNLFAKYPCIDALAKADLADLENCIHSLGLYKNKAKNLQNLAAFISNNLDGAIPNDYKTLISLPGVGNKTARVVLMESFGEPSFPVDTHVARISARLGLVKEGLEPIKIETKLESYFDEEDQAKLHHCFIDFGRDICRARKPECSRCFLASECHYFLKKSSFKTGK